jgi:nucleotide-binding universal stress UspA family protein/predicted Ser/Thr protein kinase
MNAPESGSEIDGFLLGERIHTGTMGWIYRLMGSQGPLPLIMKIPRSGPGERAVNVVGFEVERMVLGALAQGPHSPTLVAFGNVETTPYLVMEYIDGVRLNDWARRAPIAPKEIAQLGSAFALALDDIHGQDVIHLDLKSTNVIYRASGEAALIDFGLSNHRHFPDLLAEDLRIPIGNWEYMAPEQILGIRCDPRSDIFALGAILYELATGRHPFGAPRTVAKLRRRLYRDPVPPSAIVAEIPAWLQEIILHCLEVDNRNRYATAAEVAFHLANGAQVRLTERGFRHGRAGWWTLARHWAHARNFEPAPCPPPSTRTNLAPVVVVGMETSPIDQPLFEALRAAVGMVVAGDHECRIACVTVVPPAASLSGEGDEPTATARHIKRIVELRKWAKPLDLPEERLTYHVLDSDKPAETLIDYATMNDAVLVVIGAPHPRKGPRIFGRVCAQVVAEAPCSVTVVRPQAGV